MGTILLFGPNGQVGWQLKRSLAPLGDLVAPYRGDGASDGLCGDLSNLEGLRQTIVQLRPTIVVNAAAYTAVDLAESESDLAHTINTLAPEAMAQAAQRVGAMIVHFSTDYVFDGTGDTPWVEDVPNKPLSVYGRTKLEGEQRVREACARHLIFRTSWVYAARGNNFAKTMLRLARERDLLRVIDDQIGAPTGADLIADVTAHAIRQTLSQPACLGTYHLAASGITSWHGYAQFVLDTARELRPELALRARNIEPIPTSAYPTAARRPLNSRLNTSRLRDTFALTLPDWRVGVRRMLAEIL